jgi:hypothetical protein
VGAHQAGIERFEPGLVEPDALKNSGPEILDQDIAAGDQFGEDLAARILPQVEGERALIASEAGEVPAEPLAYRSLLAHRVAFAGRLDLDYLGPMSPSIIEQNDPARMRVRSTTQSPDSGIFVLLQHQFR